MKKIIAVAVVFMTAGFMLSAMAEEESATTVLMESRYLPEVDVDQQSGSLAISETRFSFEHEFKVDGRLPVTFSMTDKHTDINSDVATFLPSSLVGREIGLGTKFPAPFTSSPNYFVGVDVFPSMYTDGWDETSSSAFRVPFRTYLIYKRDENFIVFGGIRIRPNYDTVVIPIAGFIYKPTPELSFNIASENPNITYKIAEKTKLLLEGDITSDEYEVEHLGQKGRVLFYRELSVGAGIEQSFTDSIKGLVSVGSVFARQIRYEDDTGKVAPDAGMYVKGRVTVKF